MLLNYETLRIIWWALMGLLLTGFALTDGFDLGAATLLPFVGRTDEERRLVINSIGATWEGNQVWFILGGGAIFAAWPRVYAVSFSGFYFAMFFVLAALILRPVGFKYRSKHDDPKWRSRWDWALFIGGFVPALVFGVAVGNVLQGVPFRLDSDLRIFYDGRFLELFGPFSLLTGLLSVAMLVMHGAGWLSLKLEDGPVLDRARVYGRSAAILAVVLFISGGVFVAWGNLGFRLVGLVDAGGPSNPHLVKAIASPGAWLHNYRAVPGLAVAPVLGIIGPLLAVWGINARRDLLVFAGSSLANIGIISTVGLSMFPFILPSSIDPGSSLTVWNASSSHLTLLIMLIVTVIFLPVVLGYTAWAYRVMFGRITTEQVRFNPDYY